MLPKNIKLANDTIKEIKENFINKGCENYIIDYFPKFLLYYIKTKLPNNLYFKENCRIMIGDKKNVTLITKFKSKEDKEKLYKEDILSKLKELNHKKQKIRRKFL